MTTIFDGWREAGYAEPFYDVEYGPDRTILTLRWCQNPPEIARIRQKLARKWPESARKA